jgi:protein tyrosine/serine phosphatase
MFYTVFLSLLLVITGEASANGIKNFRVVDKRIYRGGMPREQGMNHLKSIGIKTILSLQSTNSTIERERDWALKRGIRFISIPLSSLFFIRPSQEKLQQIHEELSDPRNYPLFVHCRHGEDRTGMAIGLYRVFQQKWSPQRAFQEMESLGYKSHLNSGLNCAFGHYTTGSEPNGCESIPEWRD